MKACFKITTSLFISVIACLSSLYAQQIDLYRETISAYEFNGSANDLSGNGNHGILHGPVLTHDRHGNPNSAYYFDGIDDYIQISPVTDVSAIEDFSISVWVNCFGWEVQPGIVPGILDQQYIFDAHSYSATTTVNFHREGFHIIYVLKPNGIEEVYNTTFFTINNFFSNQLQVGSPLLNEWHHIVFIRKGNRTYHYFDGELIHSNNVSTMGLDMAHDWYIGTFTANNPYYNDLNYNFYGVIDDVYIYNRALNECEIEALYKGVFPPER